MIESLWVWVFNAMKDLLNKKVRSWTRKGSSDLNQVTSILDYYTRLKEYLVNVFEPHQASPKKRRTTSKELKNLQDEIDEMMDIDDG